MSNFRKTSLFAVCGCVLLTVLLGVCFLTAPSKARTLPSRDAEEVPAAAHRVTLSTRAGTVFFDLDENCALTATNEDAEGGIRREQWQFVSADTGRFFGTLDIIADEGLVLADSYGEATDYGWRDSVKRNNQAVWLLTLSNENFTASDPILYQFALSQGAFTEKSADAFARSVVIATHEDEAQTYLQSAFGFDAATMEPTDRSYDMDGLLPTTFEYQISEQEQYYAELHTGSRYPGALLHLTHLNEERSVPLPGTLPPAYIDRARAFVHDLYGVNCGAAEVHAFGYSDRLAVQLDFPSGEAFSVRFYADENEPCGIFYTEYAEVMTESMKETFHAVQYF